MQFLELFDIVQFTDALIHIDVHALILNSDLVIIFQFQRGLGLISFLVLFDLDIKIIDLPKVRAVLESGSINVK